MSAEPDHYRGVAQQYDQLARHGAYGTLAPDNRGGRKGEYVARVFDAALLPRIRAGHFDSLLDFGCGTGIFARQAAGLVRLLAGVDVSPGILDVAAHVCEGLGNVTLAHTDGEHLSFAAGSFDCIVAREVLCYVPDDRLAAVFTELHRVLKPGGRFFVIDQVSDTPYWQRYPGTPRQVKRSPAALRDCAVQCGFTLVEQSLVRTPRFPGIYLAWWGLVPRALIPALARLEVRWHRFGPRPSRRWWDDLFLFERPR